MFSAVVLSLAALAGTSAAKGTPTRSHHDVARQASSAFTPLANKHIPYNQIPYQVDPNPGDRGSQSGYNICNSTTQNQQSLCQTLIINSLEDFCLWGPPVPNSQVGDTEGQSIAWCTTNTHGTRVIPAGAITGAQFMRTPDYIQITGLIDQTQIDMAADDGGGEMDPHGADLRGNPLGGLVYSNAYGNGYTQIIEWHNFMGSNVFCLKACDPAGPNAANFCQHIYDRIGCQYNAPAAYVDGQFTSCLGDNQDFPGVYTGADGKVSTYTQPPESLGPISTMPYTARIPASSSCTTYQSTALYSNQPTPTAVATTAAASSVAATSAAATPAVVGNKVSSAASKATTSSSHSASTSANAAGAPTKFGMGGVTGIAVGLIGAAIGAVVAL